MVSQGKIIFILLIFLLFPACNTNSDVKKNKAVSENNKNSKLHSESEYKKLLSYMKTLSYKKAENSIKTLLAKYPKNAELFYLYAVMTKNIKPDPLEAIKILQVTVQLDDKYGDAWKLLGDLYFIRKEYKNALKSWELAIESIKNNGTLYYRLANLYYSQKDYKPAIKYFTKSLKIDDKLEWSYYYLAEIYFRALRKPEKGIEYLKKGLKILPKSKNLNQKLAIFYYDTEKYKEAIKWNKEVLKIINYDNFAIENISDAYMQLKNYDKAIEWLDKIIKEQPKSVYYIKKKADIYIIDKKFKEAVELLEFAYRLKNDSELKSKIAKLYLTMGDKEKYQEMVKELKNSDNPNDRRVGEYLRLDGKNANSLDYVPASDIHLDDKQDLKQSPRKDSGKKTINKK